MSSSRKHCPRRVKRDWGDGFLKQSQGSVTSPDSAESALTLPAPPGARGAPSWPSCLLWASQGSRRREAGRREGAGFPVAMDLSLCLRLKAWRTSSPLLSPPKLSSSSLPFFLPSFPFSFPFSALLFPPAVSFPLFLRPECTRTLPLTKGGDWLARSSLFRLFPPPHRERGKEKEEWEREWKGGKGAPNSNEKEQISSPTPPGEDGRPPRQSNRGGDPILPLSTAALLPPLTGDLVSRAEPGLASSATLAYRDGRPETHALSIFPLRKRRVGGHWIGGSEEGAGFQVGDPLASILSTIGPCAVATARLKFSLACAEVNVYSRKYNIAQTIRHDLASNCQISAVAYCTT